MPQLYKLGQYVTTHPALKEAVHAFVRNAPDTILEPSVGRGDLVAHLASKMPAVVFDMYEIDRTVPLLSDMPTTSAVTYCDFMERPIARTYDTIVGNPPYVRTTRGNLYIDFTEKCFRLLAPRGELVFVVPSDFFKLTCAAKLLDEMMRCGTFTHIFHPHDEKMFANATIDVVVFRYCRACDGTASSGTATVLYNDEPMHIVNSHGLITFSADDAHAHPHTFSDHFTICVGFVSGKEAVFKHAALGNIDVLNGENKLERYIYVDAYPCSNADINAHLLRHKDSLLDRSVRKITESNWFEWGAPRNKAAVDANRGRVCIYVYTRTRRSTVAFVGTVGYFGGGFLYMLIPKSPETDLVAVVAYLNSDAFKTNFVFSGRFKIGHRNIANSVFPVGCITAP